MLLFGYSQASQSDRRTEESMRLGTFVLSAGISVLVIAAAAPGYTDWKCRWDGTAPACAGKCLPGERNVGGGGGAKALGAAVPPIGELCITGTKELCCTEVAAPTPPLAGGWAGANIDRPGGDFANFDLNGTFPSDCRDACAKDSRCQAWTYVHPGVQGPKARCWLKASVPPPIPNTCCISDTVNRTDLGVH